MLNILTVLSAFYGHWNVQVFVLFSLLLQVILILVAPVRRVTSNGFIIFLIWVAYLLADWAATFTIGLISRRHDQVPKPGDDPTEILAFWAPFLLLHLGGPDTITAFSLEDNALWRRHLFDFITQVATALVVFFQPFSTKHLRVSTFLVFGAGTIKYLERTCALFLADQDTFRKLVFKEPGKGPDKAKLTEIYEFMKRSNLPTEVVVRTKSRNVLDWKELDDLAVVGKLDDLAVVRHAYHFFTIFKRLIMDFTFSFHESEQSRVFFLGRDPQDALKVLQVELNFLYDVLYTKIAVVRSSIGMLLRFVSLWAVLVALFLFYPIDKQGFRKIDIGVTYFLLCGAIILDGFALLRHFLSDWTVAYLEKISRKKNWGRCISRAIPVLLFFRTFEIIKCRWSGSVPTYNLIDYCLKERNSSWTNGFSRYLSKSKVWRVVEHLYELKFWKVVEYLYGSVKNLYDSSKYVSKKPLEGRLWNFIYSQLKAKAQVDYDPEDAERICSARGDWVLLHNLIYGDNELTFYTVGVDYDQSLLIWHVATYLCYKKNDANGDDRCEISKIISEYMLYLLVMQPTMMSTVARIGQIRFHDACVEATKFFKRKVHRMEIDEQEHNKACEAIYEMHTDTRPIGFNGDRSKYILFDGCILAKELLKLKENVRWKLISEVWVELLSYAASNCRPDAHAAQLSKGGELITFVWLLMAHLGISSQSLPKEGDTIVVEKLFVGK